MTPSLDSPRRRGSPWAAAALAPFPELVDRLPEAALARDARVAFRALAADLFASYRRYDQLAITGQRQHQAIVTVVGLFGTLAVLLGIVQLRPVVWFPGWVETGAVVIASTAVILGLIAARHHRWLLRRHQAERCQLLFWRLLIDPTLWGGAAADALAAARREQDRIRAFTYSRIKRWTESDEASEQADSARPAQLPEPVIQLYADHRLEGQARYFAERARSHRRFHRLTGRIALPAFVLSVVASLAHFAVHLTGERMSFERLGALLLIASAAIPVLANGFRLMHGALEPARNFTRYLSKQRTLVHLIRRLRERNQAPADLLRDCAFGEQVLEFEHREWLRLMMEAEWIG